MQINIDICDKHGIHLSIGDTIELYDWGGEHKSLGIAKLIWNDDEGRVDTTPSIIEDPHDFWKKALPRCEYITSK